MASLRRKFAWLIATIATLFAIASIVFSLQFNQNDFKKQLFKSIAHSTQYKASTQQAVTWSFIPWLGVDLHQLKLTPKDPKHPTIVIDHTHIIIAPLPLLRGHIIPDGIGARGVHVYATQAHVNLTPMIEWFDRSLTHWPQYFSHLSLEITEGTLYDRQRKPWATDWVLHVNNITKDSRPLSTSATLPSQNLRFVPQPSCNITMSN